MTLRIPRIPSRASALIAATLLAGLSFSQAVSAQQTEGLDDPGRAGYMSALAGKTVAFVPLTMGFDLTRGWLAGLKAELEPLGVKVIVRDPNLNVNVGAQAITTLINEKADVIIVQPPDPQTYTKLLKRAEETGSQVVTINMRTAYVPVLHVGNDWTGMGEQSATAMVQACKGKSGKVAILLGSFVSSDSTYTLKGFRNVFAKHPEIKVVSVQSGDWDAVKSKGIVQTVLKQHPDLCGVLGPWDGQDSGSAAAIKEAGLTGKVFLITSGAGEQSSACDQVKAGAYDIYMSYDVSTQAKEMAASIKWLLQNKGKTGTTKGTIYSRIVPITKANASTEGICWKLGKT